MKYCKECGSELRTKASFCSICGAKVIDELDELAIRFLNGDQDAFSEIYSRTYSWVIKYISARVNSCDVEDCAQQAYLKLYNNIGSYHPESGRFRPWFNTVLSNCCKDVYKSVARYNSHLESMYDEEDNEIEFVDPGISPEQYMEQQDIANILNQVLSELNDNQRQCLMLYYLEDMKYQEIADILDIPLNSVKSSINKGKAKAQTKLVEMEKRGVKLFNIAPFSFFIVLLRSCDFSAFYSFTGVWTQFINGLTAGTAAGTAAGAAAAGTSVAGTGGASSVGVGEGAASAGIMASGGGVAGSTMGGEVAGSSVGAAAANSSVAGAKAGAVGSGTAKAAATVAGKSVAAKIAIGLSITALATTAAVAVIAIDKNKKEDKTTEITTEISTEVASVTTEEVTEEDTTEASTDVAVDDKTARYNAFAEVLSKAENAYGVGEMIKVSELDFSGQQVDINDLEAAGVCAYNSTYKGVFYAKLLDFDNDGDEELLYLYRSGAGKYIYEHVADYQNGEITDVKFGQIVHLGYELSTHGMSVSEIDGSYYLANYEQEGEDFTIYYLELKGDSFVTAHTYKEDWDSSRGETVCTFDGTEVTSFQAINDNEKINIDFDFYNIWADSNFDASQYEPKIFELDVLAETKKILGMENTQPIESENAQYKAYSDWLDDVEAKYGKAEVVEASSINHEGVEVYEGFEEEIQGVKIFNGLHYARLLDFDNDGNEELIYVYRDNLSMYVNLVVIGYVDGKIKILGTQDYLSFGVEDNIVDKVGYHFISISEIDSTVYYEKRESDCDSYTSFIFYGLENGVFSIKHEDRWEWYPNKTYYFDGEEYERDRASEIGVFIKTVTTIYLDTCWEGVDPTYKKPTQVLQETRNTLKGE